MVKCKKGGKAEIFDAEMRAGRKGRIIIFKENHYEQ